VKLLDCGLARLLTHSQYVATTRVGSVSYMAPEQFEGAAGMNADVWALGVTFFQMVSNTLPFVAGDESVLVRKILYEAPDLDPLEASCGDARLVGVVRRALEKESAKRYRHAGEFAVELDAVLRHAAAVSPLEGELEVLLRSALQTAEVASPCILWIDELEKAFAGLGQGQDSGVSQRLFGAFLTWLKDRTAAVFVVATANDVAHLPPEFTRKGRFDETFFVGLPVAREREAIWQVHLCRPRRIESQIDVGRLVEASAGFAGAEIAEAVVSAM